MSLLLLKVVRHSSLHFDYILFRLKIGTHGYRFPVYQSNRIQFASLVVVVGNYLLQLESPGLKFDTHARIHSNCLRTRICLAILAVRTMLTRGAFWPDRSNFGNVFKTKPGNVDFLRHICIFRAIVYLRTSELLSQCTVPVFLPWGAGAFWPISTKLPKLPFKFWTCLQANAMFFHPELFC